MEDTKDTSCDVENNQLEPTMNDDESIVFLCGDPSSVLGTGKEPELVLEGLNITMDETNNEDIMDDDDHDGDYDEDYVNKGQEEEEEVEEEEIGDEELLEDPQEEPNCEEVMDEKCSEDILETEEHDPEEKELENVNKEVTNEECMKHDEEVEEYGGDEEKGDMREGDKNANKEEMNGEANNGEVVKVNANNKVVQLVKTGKLVKNKKKTLKGKRKVISSEENLTIEASNEGKMKEKVKIGTQGVEKQQVDAELQIKEKENHEDQLKKKEKTFSKDKSGKLRRRGKKGAKNKKFLNGMNEMIPKNTNAQQPANNKMAKYTGMIFMCSSQTKMDCYSFKVLGLPASKRDIVLNIYEGMKLFLFDFDLKLLYGIYRAAGPGGYNIEPKAFHSGFPSQVRFVISEDCLPLPEEKFKTVIKENYYSKGKFDCQLTPEQVNNLCKLFRASSRASKLNGLNKNPRPEPRALDGGRSRKRHAREEPRNEDRNKKQRCNEDRTRKQSRGQERKSPLHREQHRGLGRNSLPRREQRRHGRKAHTPPAVPRPLPLPPHLPSIPVLSHAYAYEGEHNARRDALDLDIRHREHIERGRDPIHQHYKGYFLDSDFRHLEEIRHHDRYDRYRDYPSYPNQLYSTAGPSSYRQTVGTSLNPSGGRVEYSMYDRYNSAGHGRLWY